MRLRDKKLAVLRLLSLESDPVSLGDLVGGLGGDFKERTVRRWLNEMVAEGLVEKTGHKRSTKYRIGSKPLEGKRTTDSCFSSESIGAIQFVRRPLYERQPTSYDHEWFDSYRPNITFYLPAATREALHAAGARTEDSDPAGTYAHQIFRRLLIDLSYNSSRLEGNTYSLLDTQRLLLSGKSAEGKLDEEKVMILNHKEAIRYLVENAFRLEVSQQVIYTLHYLLADALVEPQYAGKVRDHWVRISGSTYIPYDNPRRLQSQLEKIAEKAAAIEDPFEQSFFLLVHVSYLQAFTDVNKRTARVCANIPMTVQNFVPLSFNDVERDDYMSAIIAIYELRDVRPMVDLFVFTYMRTCVAYDSTVKAMGFDEVRVRYRSYRRQLVSEVINQKLTGSAMIEHIEAKSRQEIPASDRSRFKEDVLEDLEHVDTSRIVGLGVTPEQLRAWQRIYLREKQ